MIRNKTSVLVVAPEASSIPVPAGKQIFRITQVGRLFPAIHELQPGCLMLDHDYLGDQTEKILRRMVFNPFYSKITIYCYKTKANTKVDALLKVLGVQHFIYAQDALRQPRPNRAIKALNELLKTNLTGKLADAGY